MLSITQAKVLVRETCKEIGDWRARKGESSSLNSEQRLEPYEVEYS